MGWVENILADGAMLPLVSTVPCATCALQQGTTFGAEDFNGSSIVFGKRNKQVPSRRPRQFAMVSDFDACALIKPGTNELRTTA